MPSKALRRQQRTVLYIREAVVMTPQSYGIPGIISTVPHLCISIIIPFPDENKYPDHDNDRYYYCY